MPPEATFLPEPPEPSGSGPTRPMPDASPEPIHLAERAAERLRAAGAPAMGGLLGRSAPVRLAIPAAAAAPQGAAPAPAAEPTPAAGSPPVPPARSRTLGVSTLMRAGMIEWGRTRSRISEEFRIVQGQVLRTQAGIAETGFVGANLVMVTSARPEEGKSFTALNLACAIARFGEVPVLLVDADAKHNSLSALLGLSGAPGLLDLAQAPKLDAQAMLVGTEVPYLTVLPIGGSSANKEMLSASLPLASTVTRIGRDFADQVIVLDAPPCMVSSDPSTLAPVVGQVIMLIEAQRTQRGEIEAAVEMVSPCETVSLLLNKVRSRAGDTFGADGYYGSYYKS